MNYILCFHQFTTGLNFVEVDFNLAIFKDIISGEQHGQYSLNSCNNLKQLIALLLVAHWLECWCATQLAQVRSGRSRSSQLS